MLALDIVVSHPFFTRCFLVFGGDVEELDGLVLHILHEFLLTHHTRTTWAATHRPEIEEEGVALVGRYNLVPQRILLFCPVVTFFVSTCFGSLYEVTVLIYDGLCHLHVLYASQGLTDCVCHVIKYSITVSMFIKPT